MIKIKLNRIPTGISSLDTIIRGGLPSGSLVLLIGDIGAGNIEFAYTSAVMLSLLKNDPERYSAVKEQLEGLLLKEESLKLPEGICYISLPRSREEVLGELERAYPPEFASVLSSNMFFKDFSTMYFRTSISPAWIVEEKPSIRTLRSVGGVKGLLKELVSVLDVHAPNNLVIIDSLTNLVRACNKDIDWHDLVSFLEDIQRRAKKWNGLIYLLLGRGIFESSKEEDVMDVVDGVLVFEWVQEGFSRLQAMYIKKFRGLMPLIAKENIVRFDTMVTNIDGFVVINVRRISGRR